MQRFPFFVPVMFCNQLANQLEWLSPRNFVIVIQPNIFLRYHQVNGSQAVSVAMMSIYQEDGEIQNDIALHAT